MATINSVNAFDITADDVRVKYDPETTVYPIWLDISNIHLFFDTVRDFNTFVDRLRLEAIEVARVSNEYAEKKDMVN